LNNLAKLGKIVEENGLDDVILLSPENIAYYLGVEAIADATVLMHYTLDRVVVYVPILDYYRYRDSLDGSVEVIGLSNTIKPSDASVTDKGWRELINEIVGSSNKVGLDKSHPSPLSIHATGLSEDKVVDVSNHINSQRMIKDDWEIEAISKAIEITGYGIYSVVDKLYRDITEAEVAGVFEYSVRSRGVREYAFPPLILFKPGNSYPHYLPSTSILGDKNLILLDVGVKVDNRCSDITRMVTWGGLSNEERMIIEIVSEAIDRALEVVQPGVKASEVDEVARKYILEKGFGEKFIHGLGHGIGVVVHEHPYIRSGSETTLEPGMVFTIEPGIYFAGQYGVRIEEDVLVTKKGVRVLSKNIERVIG